MKEIVVVWFDPAILSAEMIERLGQHLEDVFGECGFVLLPTGVTRIEVLK